MNGRIRLVRTSLLPLPVVMGLLVLLFSVWLMGSTSAVIAQEYQEQETAILLDLKPRMQTQTPIQVTVVFTDPAVIAIFDLDGNPVGNGRHIGELKCQNDNCNKTTLLDTFVLGSGDFEYEYRFKSLQAYDPVDQRLIVAGTGTKYSDDSQRERFLFTATFADNRDGTIDVTYVASRPDASFIIPRSAGTFKAFSRP